MDSISQLPDALLLGILSLLPAKDVVATMVLSKRWQFLWMFVPKLIYDDSYQNIEFERFSRFVYRSLLLHEAPVIETLHFKLGPKSGVVDIGVWTRTAVKRCVRDLIVEMDCCSSSTAPVMLPRSLYSGCSILVKLKLKKVVLVDVTSPFSFPSLKKLTLKSVKYPDDEFVQRLLSNCPVLESLYVKQCIDDNVTIFTVKVPSLKSLVLDNLVFRSTDIGSGYVIDAPSLERFTLHDAYEDRFCVIENEMPNIVEAYVDVAYSHPGTILSSITSVKHLTLCITSSEDAYPVGIVFCSLVYLEIWAMETEWSADLNLLMCVLRNSPNLRALKLEQINSVPRQPRSCWREPSSVPECVIWSLETLEWIEYEGAEEEKKIIEFILRNAKCLKKATISTDSTDPNEKLEMLKALSLFPRRSPTCQLAFD
ncbi:F-box-like domain superfamily [Arabidopsis suecica]|uniref:F-box-like domain superfamily n=2 Tax=Arabidopsis suecica TaxID=45249 RepID=A0A8T1Y1Q5_ARASU|nr:F-box-like domain superfamily [Arabidopsis suecica]